MALSLLEHYIEEACAFAVQAQLPAKAMQVILKRSEICWDLVQTALVELASSAGLRSAHPEAFCTVHPIMRRILRRQRFEEVKQALVADFQEEPD